MASAATRYAQTLSPKTPVAQTQPINGRESEMVKNSAGGFVFDTGVWTALQRFLILGTEKQSYYTSAQKLTKDAAANTIKAIQEDGVRVVSEIVAVSDAGRAAKNDAAVFALALCLIYGDAPTKAAVEANIQNVCRIPTHLFDFVSVIKLLGKWNASAKRTIANWYNRKRNLEYTVLKYQQRNGWAHRDVLRLAHVKPTDQHQDALFHWLSAKNEPSAEKIQDLLLVHKYEHLRDNPTVVNALHAINTYDFSHEMIPRDLLKEPAIWEAMLPKMGLTALIRNLGRLSSLGLTKAFTPSLKVIVEKLGDQEALRKARIHPINVLAAMQQYKQGKGDKGSLTWPVSQEVRVALEGAFYDCFKYLEPTGKNYLLAIDCSGSMFSYQVCGLNNVTAAEAAAVMAMAIARTEKNYHFVGFNTSCGPLNINHTMTLDQVMATIRKFNWSGTDISQAAIYATKNKLDVDVFCIFTDNETYAGRIHPTQALQQFREVMKKPDARQVVCGTSVTNFTVADPKDPRQLDVVGFDSAVPALISEFAQGKF